MRWPWSKSKRVVVTSDLPRAKMLRAKFDSAQTTGENRRHWANADLLSADAAASPIVRRIVRSRARYEVANNSIARGIVLTLANDLIGTGPRLQVLTENTDLNRRIEQAFAGWAKAVGLAAKLRTMRMARAQDGEAFALLLTNPGLRSPVKLDVRLVEADRIATPGYGLLGIAGDIRSRAAAKKANKVDGIVFDEFGNPAVYHVLKRHPGGTILQATAWALNKYDQVPADNVIHWFRRDRPEQSRGLPDIMSALPLFALLRRYTLATLTAAETAANMSVIMETKSPAGGDAAEVDPWITMELERNTIMFSPEGWSATQLKSEHPSEVFEGFRKAIINDIARCLNIPRNVAMCDSSDYNYASGRLDHQTYFKSIHVERTDLEVVALDRIFSAWAGEAELLTDFKLLRAEPYRVLPHQWFWEGREHVDPRKEATAQAKRLEVGTTTLAIEYGHRGLDWEEQLQQRAKEIAMCKRLGIPLPKSFGDSAGAEQIAEEVAEELE